jgi:hypothetical protein
MRQKYAHLAVIRGGGSKINMWCSRLAHTWRTAYAQPAAGLEVSAASRTSASNAALQRL